MASNASVAIQCYKKGAYFANPCYAQIHPTCIPVHEKQLVSQSDYDTALDTYNKAKQAYDVAKQDYVKSKTNLGYATVYSPVDGIVLSRSVSVGQTVAATYSTPKLFTIAKNLKDLQVVAKVDEADIGNIVDGQRVSFTVDAFPDDTFIGLVKQVRLNAGASNNVVTYQVIITTNNESMKLKPGLTANVTIYTSEKSHGQIMTLIKPIGINLFWRQTMAQVVLVCCSRLLVSFRNNNPKWALILFFWTPKIMVFPNLRRKMMRVHVVTRVKHVETQTRKTPFQRWENVQQIFQLEHPERIEGKHILVIDDVVTTGATALAFIESFAILKETKVSLLTLAVAAQ